MSNPSAPRWGPVATLAWTVFLILFWVMVQLTFEAIILGASMAPGRKPGDAEVARLASNGDFITASIFIADTFTVAALLAIVKARAGATYADSIALVPSPAGWMRTWIPILLVFVMASDTITWLLGKPLVPEVMQLVWASAERISLLLALILVAPVMEELVFRGFLISGLRPTRLGASGAVLVSSFAWASLHLEYDLYGMATIFALGILLGTARVKTGSVVVSIALHMISNIISTVEMIAQAAS